RPPEPPGGQGARPGSDDRAEAGQAAEGRREVGQLVTGRGRPLARWTGRGSTECQRGAGRKAAPVQAMRRVLRNAVAHATSSSPKMPTASQAKNRAPVSVASTEAPVTTVPTGKVKLHQVSEKGRPRRIVRTVIRPAIAIQARAKPKTGSP